MRKSPKTEFTDRIELPIFVIRNQRVILDADLALINGVTTKALNQAIKRHQNRFPDDFAFQLTNQEMRDLKSQFAASSVQHAGNREDAKQWSQSVITVSEPFTNQHIKCIVSQVFTPSERHRRVVNRPRAFTEHGTLMAANILRSPRAVQMSVYVVRAFIKQREQLMANATILKRLAEIDHTLLEHDDALRTIWTQLQPLLNPPPDPPKPRIGFDTNPN